jgi:exonuclease III
MSCRPIATSIATTSYRDNALLQPEPREAYARLLQQGWTDAIRAAIPRRRSTPSGTTSATAGRANAGMRIDHLLLSESIAGRLREAEVDRDERGREGASDHAPVWARLAEKRATRRAA